MLASLSSMPSGMTSRHRHCSYGVAIVFLQPPAPTSTAPKQSSNHHKMLRPSDTVSYCSGFSVSTLLNHS
jgi:hypothetical protein